MLTTGPAVKNHISSENGKKIDCKISNCVHLSSLVCRRVPPQHPHLHLQHLHRRVMQLAKKIPQPKEVEVRVRSHGETRCTNQQKSKTHVKMLETKKYRSICCMTCRTGYRGSEKYWLMKVVLLEPRRNPEPGDRDTSSSSHELPMESRPTMESGSGKHSFGTHFPKDTNCDICLKKKITRASCRRRAGTVVPRAENFGD